MTSIITGQKASISGIYLYTGHPEGKMTCTPTSEEMQIPLSKGETAPPVKSCEQPAKWTLVQQT